MTKCIGCGALLQKDNKDIKGYVSNDNNLCDRCFKIKNYNLKDNIDVISNTDLVNKINSMSNHNLFLCDLLSLNDEVINTFNSLNKPKTLVITKIDIITKNIDARVLEDRIKSKYNLDNVILLSIKSGYGISSIKDILRQNKNILVCGPTSSGKSSLINYLFNTSLTVSSYSNTTLDFIEITDSNNTIYDAPGFNFEHILPDIKLKGSIIPKTINLKTGYKLVIDDVELYTKDTCNITIFFNSNVSISTKRIDKHHKKHLDISSSSDLLINNIGFIYFKSSNKVYFDKGIFTTRKSLIGDNYE